MGNTFNTTSKDVYINQDHSDQQPVLIPHDSTMNLSYQTDSKYKIKKESGKLVAKIWTGTNGWIVKFKNYRTHIFVKVDQIRASRTEPISEEFSLKLQEFKDINTGEQVFVTQMLFICKREHEEHIPLPIFTQTNTDAPVATSEPAPKTAPEQALAPAPAPTVDNK